METADDVKQMIEKGIAANKNDNRKALELFDAVIRANPKNAEAYFQRAIATKDNGEALPFFQKAVDLDPGHKDAWDHMARIHVSAQRYEDAIRCWDKVIQIEPDNPDRWFDKAAILSMISRKEEAISAFQKILRLDPQYKDKLVVLTMISQDLLWLDRYKDALGYLEQLVRMAPDDVGYWNNKSVCELVIGKDEDALTSCLKGLKIEPTNAPILKRTVELLANQKKFDDALIFVDRLIAVEPENSEHLHTKVMLLKAAGKNREVGKVESEYEKIRKKDPKVIFERNMLDIRVVERNTPILKWLTVLCIILGFSMMLIGIILPKSNGCAYGFLTLCLIGLTLPTYYFGKWYAKRKRARLNAQYPDLYALEMTGRSEKR